jgi:hypothetical protein
MIRPKNSKRRVRKFLAYDFEWVPDSLNMRMCGVFDGERYRYYHTVDDFINHELTAKNHGKWFYAHAGGLNDFQFVFSALVNRGATFTARAAFSGSSAIIVVVKKDRYSWTFVDSYWLMRAPLADIGRWTGLEKGGGEEHSKKWYATVPFSELVPYNERDCVILYTAINQFENTILGLGGELQKTQASCALDLFRRRYLTQDIYTSRVVNSHARQAYFASRVEVFEKECGEAFYYDVNSSFPFAMTFPVPGNLIRSTRYLPDRLMMSPDDTPFLAYVDVTVPETYLPPLPYRIKSRVFFPIGRWKTWMTSVDLELLLVEGGKLNKVIMVMEFEPNTDLKDYAMDLYTRRKQSTDGFERVAYKYLLNSLYGKFAEDRKKQAVHLNPSTSVMDRLNRKENMLMPGVWIEEREGHVPHEHVPMSAHITAIARRTLYRFLSSSRDFFYCDTDGFATTDDFTTTDEIGGLKLEKIIHKGRFFAPKLYDLFSTIDGELTNVVKAKGFSIKNSLARFNRVVSRQEIEIDRLIRIRENLKHNRTAPIEQVITKTFCGASTPKRYFYPDGTSRPWYLSELESAA